MPVKSLKSLADKAGISMKKAEEYWKKAKQIAKEERNLPDDDTKWSDEDWAYVMGIVKRMMGLKESRREKAISFERWLGITR